MWLKLTLCPSWDEKELLVPFSQLLDLKCHLYITAKGCAEIHLAAFLISDRLCCWPGARTECLEWLEMISALWLLPQLLKVWSKIAYWPWIHTHKHKGWMKLPPPHFCLPQWKAGLSRGKSTWKAECNAFKEAIPYFQIEEWFGFVEVETKLIL